MTISPDDAGSAGTGGRPRTTSHRAIEQVAVRLFVERGYEQTTVDEIAVEAGVSRRTFFRYFPSKSGVLFGDFAEQMDAIRGALEQAPPDQAMMDCIREAIVRANHYHADDVPEMRSRRNLLATVPALQAAAAVQYASWEAVISEFAGARLGQDPESLYPLAIGRASFAVCRAAFDRWASRADADLQVYLDAALRALSDGFNPAVLSAPPVPRRGPRQPDRAVPSD